MVRLNPRQARDFAKVIGHLAKPRPSMRDSSRIADTSFYQSLRARGKSGKVALVAAMRKLLVILNAKMRDQMKGPTLA